MHLVTKMRVAALYLVASAFVISMSAPGSHPLFNGGAFATSSDGGAGPIALWEDRSPAPRGSREGFDERFSASISVNAAAVDLKTARDHPAARRHAELTAMLTAMTPPTRSSAEIEAELATTRGLVDERQKVFDGLASELDDLRDELSRMDRREAATEIAERIDATQGRSDEVRGELVHALLGLTAAQAELKTARRFEDIESELVALEEMMLSVRDYVQGGAPQPLAPRSRDHFVPQFTGGFN